MGERSLSFVLRVVVNFNCGKASDGTQKRFIQYKTDNENSINPLFDEQMYTGNHIVIFENQLKQPNSLAAIDHSF